MYKLIGGDGNEYGPVTADQLRTWISEGRADAQTKVQVEGATEWKALGELPEFADALRPPLRTTSTPASGDTEKLAETILARDYEVNISDCLGRGWALLTSDFWPLVGVTLLVFLVEVVVASASSSVGGVLSLLLGGVLSGGLCWYFLKKVREGDAAVGDAFAGFTLAFVQLMLVGLISDLLTIFGLLLCILPGIYVAVCWSFAVPLVIDKRLEFWPAMELSRKVVHQHWWAVFGFVLVCWLLFFVGVLVCFVGLFVAMPWVTGAYIYLYEDIFSAAAPLPEARAEPSEGGDGDAAE